MGINPQRDENPVSASGVFAPYAYTYRVLKRRYASGMDEGKTRQKNWGH
jgi:hypothetical protein